jgi:hypothetical protein
MMWFAVNLHTNYEILNRITILIKHLLEGYIYKIIVLRNKQN